MGLRIVDTERKPPRYFAEFGPGEKANGLWLNIDAGIEGIVFESRTEPQNAVFELVSSVENCALPVTNLGGSQSNKSKSMEMG